MPTTRLSVFSNPFLLGFDAFEERIDRLAKAAEGYPPYNIERTTDPDGTERFLVSVAVAGFSADELDIAAEEGQLVIAGRQAETPERDYLHRGIATRQFQRTFLLAQGMQVKDATLAHGLLVVVIERPQARRTARRIEIRSV